MSMSFSFIGVKGSIDDVVASLEDVWQDDEIVEKSDVLSSFDDLYAWCAPRTEYLSGSFPDDAKGLYSFSDWAIILDFSMLWGGDREALIELSRKFGSVVAVQTQGTSGFASFASYRDGFVERTIEMADGSLRTEGTPLSAESKFDLSSFYFDEADHMWMSFDLPSFLETPAGEFIGIQLRDNADYSELERKRESSASEKKPWWKFWA
jgi:hypothetical protein